MSIKKHVFVCVQNRPVGHPRGCCLVRGGQHLYRAFVEHFDDRALWNTVRLTNSGCLGPCKRGPSVAIYPDGVFYGGVSEADVAEIIDQHLIQGRPVDRLKVEAPDSAASD